MRVYKLRSLYFVPTLFFVYLVFRILCLLSIYSTLLELSVTLLLLPYIRFAYVSCNLRE